MKFLNTKESEINSEILSNLLQSILPNNPLTVGLVCLAVGIGYYSWNFYKNKKQELNIKVIEKNDEKNTTLNSKNLTNQSSNISKCEYNMILDDATKINQIILDNNNSKNDEEQYDMLNDAKSEINVEEQYDMLNDAKSEINVEEEYDMLNDAKSEINVEEEYDMLNDAKSEINKEDEWVIIDNQSNVKNTIHKDIL
ncbi:hypothetical protein [Spiroplasma endosymbiont of Aleiodes alternator]|uniref:hypothetical protein n=1 Tax=Spiroplasma endosymbiont of Aleiodes alternator TaxID=3139329 RepID=UPI003CCA77EA